MKETEKPILFRAENDSDKQSIRLLAEALKLAKRTHEDSQRTETQDKYRQKALRAADKVGNLAIISSSTRTKVREADPEVVSRLVSPTDSEQKRMTASPEPPAVTKAKVLAGEYGEEVSVWTRVMGFADGQDQAVVIRGGQERTDIVEILRFAGDDTSMFSSQRQEMVQLADQLDVDRSSEVPVNLPANMDNVIAIAGGRAFTPDQSPNPNAA